MNKPLTTIASGEWSRHPELTDYRAEWLSDMLVERATRAPDSPVHRIGQHVVGAPGYIWFRFWLANGEHILEKYFDDHGQPLGMYARIGMAVPHKGRGFSAMNLLLSLWITDDARVTVLNEEEFEQAVKQGLLSPIEAEHAEQQIREVTMAIAHKRYPPPIVRNLTITMPEDQSA
jgi:predicted RNA-binding protein associated with RNAse of E/G family